jgi:hypothetical protein
MNAFHILFFIVAKVAKELPLIKLITIFLQKKQLHQEKSHYRPVFQAISIPKENYLY